VIIFNQIIAAFHRQVQSAAASADISREQTDTLRAQSKSDVTTPAGCMSEQQVAMRGLYSFEILIHFSCFVSAEGFVVVRHLQGDCDTASGVTCTRRSCRRQVATPSHQQHIASCQQHIATSALLHKFMGAYINPFVNQSSPCRDVVSTRGAR
jgi:hypothetical protein